MYDVAADTWSSPISMTLDGVAYQCEFPRAAWDFDTEIVSAAYAPDGSLWVISGCTNTLFTVDPSTGEMTDQGQPTRADGSPLNIGSDLSFSTDGELVVYTQNAATTWPMTERGLYAIDADSLDATTIGDPALTRNATGVAHRENGRGDVVLSERLSSALVVIDAADASEVCRYDMTLDGDAFTHSWGDLATGRHDDAPAGKSLVCHRGNTLEISTRAASAHIAHGDLRGSCPSDPVDTCE